MTDADRCVSCGAVIPEGTQVCPQCARAERFGRFDPGRLREEMLRNGVKQVDLARKVGVTPVSMSRYCNGAREPKPGILARMARALNVTPDYLTGTDVVTSPEDGYIIAMGAIRKHTGEWSAEQKRKMIEKLLDGME